MKPLRLDWFTDPYGPNGRNRAGMVSMNTMAQHKTAVYAQEAYEAETKLKDIPKLRFRFFWSDNRVRNMEFKSHKIECMIKMRKEFYNMSHWDAHHPEAISMKNGYNNLFKDYSIEEIKARMHSYAGEANQWIDANIGHIRDFHRRHG